MQNDLKNDLKICTLGSGSKGNSFVISSTEHGTLLIDAGFTAKQMELKLAAAEIDISSIHAVLLTHDHDDHAHGCRVFCNRHKIPLYCSFKTAHYLNGIDKLPKKVIQFEAGDHFSINAFDITVFAVQHDAEDPVGFRIRCCGREIGIATDLGELNALCRQRLRSCHALILESNYDREMLYASERTLQLKRRISGSFGHLDNQDALREIGELLDDCSSLLMFVHVSNDCNCRELVENNLSCRLKELNKESVNMYIARQDSISPWFEI